MGVIQFLYSVRSEFEIASLLLQKLEKALCHIFVYYNMGQIALCLNHYNFSIINATNVLFS